MSLIRAGLVTLAALGPAYGLQLRSELAARTGRELNSGQVYSTLERAERDGLVAAAGRTHDGLALFAATPAGVALREHWLAHPVDELEEMIFQLRLARSLPDFDSGDLVTQYRERWSDAVKRSKPRRHSGISPAAALDAAVAHARASAALQFVEAVAAVSDAGWPLTDKRPKRGRRAAAR